MRFIVGGPRIFGHRTGVIFGPDDFRRLTKPSVAQDRRPSAFAYVIRKSIQGHVKVGVAADPRQRLRDLQTGSSELLELVYTCVVQSNDATRVEHAAHDILEQRRLVGEWFDYTPDVAVAAIAAASHRLGDPVVPIPVDKIGDVLALAAMRGAAAKPKSPLWQRVIAYAVLITFGVVAALAITLFRSFS